MSIAPNAGALSSRPRLSAPEWLLLIIALGATAALCAGPVMYRNAYHRFPLDAYYYFEMARNLVHNGTMLLKFEQGLPNKFFPGYPLLLGAASIFSYPEIVWPWLNVTASAGACLALYIAATGWGFPRHVVFAAIALFAGNPVVGKWAAAPAAEICAVVWLLLSVAAAARARLTQSWRWTAVCGLLAGAAAITRPDAFFFVPVLGAIIVLAVHRERGRAALWFVVPAVLPVLALMASRQLASGQVTYLGELKGTAAELKPLTQFEAEAIRIVREPGLLHDWTAVNVALVMFQMTTYAIVVLSVVIAFGRKFALLAWSCLLYLVAHSFWYYTSERFNILILPAISLLFVGVIDRALSQVRVNAGIRGWLIAAVALALVAGFEIYTPLLIKHHLEQLVSDGARPHEMAAIANQNPAYCWAETGPDFAYFYHGPVYMDHDQPYFYHKTATDEAQFFREHDITWIVTHAQNPRAWFTQHPDVSSATLQLHLRARDRFYNLYSVTKK